MIKRINYIWFGGKPKTPNIRACIASWRKYCPDWEIVEWNERNFPVNKYRWIREALEHKCYAFASDCARMLILLNGGGATQIQIWK